MSGGAPRHPACRRVAGVCALGALAPATAFAQPARPPAPRVTVAAVGGLAAGASVASGRVATAVSGSPESGVRPFTAARTAALRLDQRALLGAEVRVRLGGAGRWAVVADAARAAGGAVLTRTQSITSAAAPEVFTTGEQTGRYERVTTWRGALGLARAFALPGAWASEVSAAAVLTRVRVGADPGLCAGLGGFALAQCEAQIGVTTTPAFGLSAPGTAVAAGLESPAWRRLRLRVRAGADVVWADGARLVRRLEPGPPPLLPAGVTARDAASGRRARLLPSASLGLALGVGR